MPYYYIQSGTFKWIKAQDSLHLLQFLIASRRLDIVLLGICQIDKFVKFFYFYQYLTKVRPGLFEDFFFISRRDH